ncbi:AAA family ATPase [Streptomonospora nanhaiensis]|uniref:Putative kinase n=1 Tax=Streptomonospora nanhaiensis TaxID=1323731 RepID=A0A853BPQ2_9ACTN|nr:AAA family ATPase [Streptomonospora nanhaiensis]MBV2366982.1 AAA family ATPase [Streptomonospora nanhaiensis]MBX9389420.1 AAA family ATPase [Streptomonospora nanhaiensis]NYI96970.1 putative kinase [Streptomonospora nanhaiensis]
MANDGSAQAPDPGCLILTGMPGAGKSTSAPLVAAHFPRAAHISGDVLSYMVVQGRVGFTGTPPEEADRQLLLCLRNMCTLANNFAENGVFPILEYTIDNRRLLDHMLALLRPRPVMLVVLAPPLEVCLARNAARPPRERVDLDYSPYYRAMEHNLAGVGWWLDTATMTPEQTAATIAHHAQEKATVEPPPSPCHAPHVPRPHR